MSDYDSGYMDGKAVMYERIAELEQENKRLINLHEKCPNAHRKNSVMFENAEIRLELDINDCNGVIR